MTFGKLLTVISKKDKPTISPLFNDTEVLSSASDKANIFPEIFSKNSTINNLGISLPAFPARTTLNSVCLFTT